jgi:hypothetical protein
VRNVIANQKAKTNEVSLLTPYRILASIALYLTFHDFWCVTTVATCSCTLFVSIIFIHKQIATVVFVHS